MTRPELIEVLSFVPGFTSDMLTGLPSERLLELYSDYFEDQDMNEQKTEEKSYAERIASFLEQMESMFPNPQAAAELRRLHEVNAELLEALKFAQSIIGHPDDAGSKFIAAAIAKAEVMNENS